MATDMRTLTKYYYKLYGSWSKYQILIYLFKYFVVADYSSNTGFYVAKSTKWTKNVHAKRLHAAHVETRSLVQRTQGDCKGAIPVLARSSSQLAAKACMSTLIQSQCLEVNFNKMHALAASCEELRARTNLVSRAMPVRGLGWHWLWGNWQPEPLNLGVPVLCRQARLTNVKPITAQEKCNFPRANAILARAQALLWVRDWFRVEMSGKIYVFDVLYNLRNSARFHSQNAWNRNSGTLEFKIFQGVHAPGPS
jgi:hypothetical protein